eukprot:contig_6943_g1606
MGHAGECGCKEVLTSFEAQLANAKRTARENLLVQGGRDQRQRDYNYARLGVVAVDLLFDSRGNWVVHGQCAREYLRVSNWWLAKLQNRTIEAAQVPVRRMAKSKVAASTNADMLISCIRRPSECLLSTLQFFKSCSMTYVFDIFCPSAHGLTGKPSNRTKVAEQQKFSGFVRAHRSPTGRTADKHGRLHGAAFYLDAKWTVLRDPVNEDNSRQSFSSSINAALVAAGPPIVHGDVPLRWLRLLFGSTKRIDGSIVPSDEHLTLYPHKTDACSTCLYLSAEIRSETQVLKRHLQQNDQATMDGHEAVQATRLVVTDLEGALKRHKNEAGRAIAYHKRCITGAAKRYAELVAMLEEVVSNVTAVEKPSERHLALTDDLISKASKQWFDVSSDYQQDTAVPSRNRSPQPGPTYFMSGETHYGHIFCAERCGETTGPTRFSRNLVYSRSERVGGSKSSDDTLSTLADMLLGGVHLGGGCPPLFRTGYGPDGPIHGRRSDV